MASWDLQALMMALTGIFNLGLGMLLGALRLQQAERDSTRGQQIALSLLSWTFAFNGVAALLYTAFILSDNSPRLLRLVGDLDIPLIVLLVAFGLHFPRPFVGRHAQQRLLLILLVVGAGLQMAILSMHALVAAGQLLPRYPNSLISWSYLVAYFFPTFLWLREIDRKSSDQARGAIALVMWGFLCYPAISSFSEAVRVIALGGVVPSNTIASALLSGIVLARLWWVLIQRWGDWGSPERFHALMSIVIVVGSVLMGLLDAAGDAVTGHDAGVVIEWLVYTAGWGIIRPSLFSYALLRHQLLGSQRLAVEGIALLMALVLAMATGLVLLPLLGMSGVDPVVLVLAVTLVLIWPIYRFGGQAIWRIGYGTVTGPLDRPSARALYLASLQSSVVGGRVESPDDAKVLQRLRDRLNISPREHALLLAELASHEEVRAMGSISRVMLMLSDGRLVAHLFAARDPTDEDVLAGMLMAIRGFVAQGLSGGGGELDTIKYGDVILAIETQDQLVLAVAVEGADIPEVRQTLGDWLAILNHKFGGQLVDWDGSMNSVAPIEVELRRLLRKSFPGTNVAEGP